MAVDRRLGFFFFFFGGGGGGGGLQDFCVGLGFRVFFGLGSRAFCRKSFLEAPEEKCKISPTAQVPATFDR